MQVLNIAMPVKAASNLTPRKPTYDFSGLTPDTAECYAELVSKADEQVFTKLKSKLNNAVANANGKVLAAAKEAGQETFTQLVVRVVSDHPDYADSHVIGVWAQTRNVADIKPRAPRQPKVEAEVDTDSAE